MTEKKIEVSMDRPNYGLDVPYVVAGLLVAGVICAVLALKPGGHILISDFRNVGEYVQALKENGIADAREKRIARVLFFPVSAAIGSKPLG